MLFDLCTPEAEGGKAEKRRNDIFYGQNQSPARRNHFKFVFVQFGAFAPLWYDWMEAVFGGCSPHDMVGHTVGQSGKIEPAHTRIHFCQRLEWATFFEESYESKRGSLTSFSNVVTLMFTL